MPTSSAQQHLWVPFWMKEFEGRFCYFSGILDCRIWLSGRKCQFWERCHFLGERTELLIVTQSPPPPLPQKSLLFTPGMVSWKAYLCSNGHLLSSTSDPHQHLPNSTNVPPLLPIGSFTFGLCKIQCKGFDGFFFCFAMGHYLAGLSSKILWNLPS